MRASGLLAALALVLAGVSCSGTKADIDVTVTVDSAMLGRSATGKLSGSVTVTVALGSFATGSHVIHPQHLDVMVGARTFSGDLGAAPGYVPTFAPGESRTATFPVSCSAADDCGASNVCAAGSPANIGFVWSDDTTTPPMVHIAPGTATVACP